ncbi:MAG: hypothetical protein GWN01_09185 [Nitrosopumilaceae archaeon]|nr:hypothetical protein [Nitrosopumilaceae archaeon]NIU87783.1 hypothetical protein [Nitrosopumilaceae archaeon]NIV65166.1 hypothetical protein [Nitrosopumilaceae archaeon]NIX61681.1 hypothetical protein [Nitrosopumilaceae archaeon]
MPTWPGSLPQKQFAGLEDKDTPAVLRTPMDTGPSTRRNRFTAVKREVTVPLILDGTDRQTFDNFFRSTLKNGTLSFDWEDPVTDSTVTFAFLGPPRWTLVAGGSTSNRLWETTLNLEIQP